MSMENTEELKPLFEGGEQAIQEAAIYLTSLGIKNSVALAPGCTPGT